MNAALAENAGSRGIFRALSAWRVNTSLILTLLILGVRKMIPGSFHG